jgi:uncharacterized membrane protein
MLMRALSTVGMLLIFLIMGLSWIWLMIGINWFLGLVFFMVFLSTVPETIADLKANLGWKRHDLR